MILSSEFLFTTIPLIAVLCNIFLLFTLMTAKKDRSIYAFMGLLVAFILWTGGSFFMRSQVFPGTIFWWQVSLSGIFMVPYLYFLLVSAYTEQKGSFLKIILGLGTLLMVVLNWFNVFMTSPEINVIENSISSNYSTKLASIFPVVLTLVIFACIYKLVRNSIKNNSIAVSYMVPLLVGVVILMAGVALNIIPELQSLPSDTMACAVNAFCIYYAFYKKRFYALSQITSKGSMYIVSLMITGMSLAAIYDSAEAFISSHFGNINVSAPFIITIFCSAIAILIFVLMNKLHDGLFVREQLHKENLVHTFSGAVNSTLKTDDILLMFTDLVREEVAAEHIYICMYNSSAEAYVSTECAQALEHPLNFKADHPLIKKLQETGFGLLYSDFQKTNAYKSMWELEKNLLTSINATYILPFKGDDKLIGLVIFSEKGNNKPYSYSEINFLESVVSVASIAIKNASLYQTLEREAQLDPLTGLLNRRAINKTLEAKFFEKASPITFVLVNLDDFSLYNELYGNDEGDQMLKNVASMLENVFGPDSIISRYGGKEFAVLLPYCDVYTAKMKTEQVRDALSDYIENNDERIKKFLTFSAGICSYPSVAANSTQLLSYTNMAVFQIKQHGKNKIEIYSSPNEYADNSKDADNRTIQELTSTIYALTAAIDAKDHYTFNHSQCVSEYASALASNAAIQKDNIEIIKQAGLLHDIGKIGIPDAILTKSGKLAPEEFSIMRQHVERSIEMIRHLPSLDYVIPAVLGHHERFDGKGYPRGISGEDIPVSARCLSIADSFDAMVSKRSYKKEMPLEDALLEIERNLGTQFDPQLGRTFIDLVRNKIINVIKY
ncbi:MAG: diguanylate cyclase [Clostridiales bacterium]|nr:diguanylate cyclase [Clostridiales bacterium]